MAPEELHLHPTQQRARDVTTRRQATSCHVLFFFSRLAPMRLKLWLIRAESSWFTPTRTVSAILDETAETHSADAKQENENKQKMDKNLWLTVSWANEDGEERG